MQKQRNFSLNLVGALGSAANYAPSNGYDSHTHHPCYDLFGRTMGNNSITKKVVLDSMSMK